MLKKLGYRRHVNRKTKEAESHPDRDAQFEHINAKVLAFQNAGHPAISVDTKKKALIGNLKNPGSDYRSQGRPDEVNVHDFADKELGKVVPYGVYDIGANAGWVRVGVGVGVDHDKSEFAVNAIRRWPELLGYERYGASDQLLIAAEGGGFNGSRGPCGNSNCNNLLTKPACLPITVCQYPPHAIAPDRRSRC